MSLLRLALRSLAGRPLASSLTALSVALGAALVIGLLALRASTRRSFLEAAQGYDAVLGPTDGSRLDAVLTALFHVGEAKGTIPWQVYEEMKRDPRAVSVVPYAMGDSFRGHHVVGTSSNLFTTLSGPDRRLLGEDLVGQVFAPNAFEAVIGSVVASKTGLRLGSRFRVMHGMVDVTHEHTEEWRVVGILRPSGAPADRAIFIPLSTFYAVGGHAEGAAAVEARRAAQGAAQDEHEHEHEAEASPAAEDDIPDAAKTLGLSAIGVRLLSPGLRLDFIAQMRQDRDDVDVAQPLDEIMNLLELVGAVDAVFELLAWVVVAVSGLGILVGLYNTIHGRRREIAILRTLGARAHHVFGVILLEALILVGVGGVCGLLLGHLALAAAAPELLVSYAIRADLSVGVRDVQVLAGLFLIGLVAGSVPALRALRTPVAKNLQPTEA